MKTRLTLLLAGLLLGAGTSAQAQVSFSAGIEINAQADFYQPLSGYGEWVDVPSYGRCWHPARVDRGWRPYTTGYWEYTDVGWYWVSDEPWAWACYHYGSWVYDPNYGWVWIPGTEWAPAWVSWREGGDYVGWAPCGPGGIALSPSWFVFIDVGHFHNHFRRSSLIVDNRTILDRTRRIGDFRRETRDFGGTRQRVVYNTGPSIDSVQRGTGRRFSPVPVQQVIRETPVPTNVRRREGSGIERPRTLPDQRGTQAPRISPETRSAPAREQAPEVSQPAPRRTAPAPTVPETRRAPEPTGREQPRVYPQSPQRPTEAPVAPPLATAPRRENVERPEAPPAPAPRRENVERPAAPPAPVERPPAPAPERPANPTGRERGNERSQEKAAPPAQRPPEERQGRPAGPPPGQERKEQDKDRP